jgi:4-amino-4-deoxychorismate lyase
MDRWWINGSEARLVDVRDRGLAYGDGLFETIAVRSGLPRLLSWHLERLAEGCGRLQLPVPDRQRLEQDLVAASAGTSHGVLKLIYTRGSGPRGYAASPGMTPTLALGIAAAEPRVARPIRLRWCETMASANPATAGLKTLGRLEQVLARSEWQDPEIAEGLMTNTEGRLVGGTASNVFLVTGGRLLTPSVARSGIAGIMRRLVIDVAGTAGIGVAIGDLPPSAVAGADEVFLTSALTGLRPVQALGDRTWEVGPVTRRLQGLLAAAGVEECAG